MPCGPRSDILNDDEPGSYHCFNRCVRRAYLCGYDAATRKNYDYRKQWLREWLIEFAGIFAIDIFKYAVQDNHFHVLVRNRPEVAQRWSDAKVLRRAMKLFPDKFRRLNLYVEPDEPLPKDLMRRTALIRDMRKRLSSISWFMKLLQERFAKRANREDGVTGVFWDGRFRCQALLDEAAVLACAVYVDLNLVHAGVCDRPEKSKFTSAYDRIQGLRARRNQRIQEGIAHDGFLCPLNTLGDYQNECLAEADKRATDDGMFEMPLTKYLQLLDFFGRKVRSDKRGAIPAELPPILERLGLDPDQFRECVAAFGTMKRRAIGSVEHLRKKAEQIGRRWMHGVELAQKFFRSADATAVATK